MRRFKYNSSLFNSLNIKRLYFGITLIILGFSCSAYAGSGKITPGADQPDQYLQKLKGKNLALVVNQTSRVGDQHIVDYLLSKHLSVKRIFAPEHGFRGEAGAGELIDNSKDPATGIQIISLFGKNHKPTAGQLEDVDLVIFDIQDVGCRFYTYISTLHYLMEACAENHKALLILDRPNPNGDYFDGPVLQPVYSSFVGMDPIPVVHGCTIGELARMINGEKWLANGVQAPLEIIKVANYTHAMPYAPPVKPSPNLPNYLSIRLYPSLCFFESTSVSVGRGTHVQMHLIMRRLWMLELKVFQADSAKLIADRYAFFANHPFRPQKGNQPRAFFQALSALTGAGKTPILAQAVVLMRGHFTAEPIVFWMSKAK